MKTRIFLQLMGLIGLNRKTRKIEHKAFKAL